MVKEPPSMKDRFKLLILLGDFLGVYFILFESFGVPKTILKQFSIIQDYVKKHVALCLVQIFCISEAISVFVSTTAVMRYLFV